MSNLNWCKLPKNWPLQWPIVAPIDIKPVYSSVSYKWAIYQNTIGQVMNCLVGMEL